MITPTTTLIILPFIYQKGSGMNTILNWEISVEKLLEN